MRACFWARRTPAPPPFSSMNSTPQDFKTSPHHVERCATRLMRTCLELAQSYNADTRLFGEFLLAPIKEAASGSALRR